MKCVTIKFTITPQGQEKAMPLKQSKLYLAKTSKIIESLLVSIEQQLIFENNKYLQQKFQTAIRRMFGIYTTNLQNSFQVQAKRSAKSLVESQTICFLIGKALQLSLFTFSLARQNIQNQRKDQSPTKQSFENKIVEISEQQLNLKSKNSKGKNRQEKQKKNKISEQQLSTSNFTEQPVAQISFQDASGRDSAENLNNTLQLQNKIICEASQIQRECSEEEFLQDLGYAEVPEMLISIDQIDMKRNQLLKRQVTNWKHTNRKQKGQLKRLKI